MQIIIDIPMDAYDNLIKYGYKNLGSFDCGNILKAVTNGTPLPKGHGDLIDISKLPVTTAYFGISDKPTKVVKYNCILNAKKIIKTDKTESEG